MIHDQELIEQIRTGKNGKALASLYHHLPAIRRMIRHYGGNGQQAEDVFQEALIIFCRKVQHEGFVLSSGIYPYLYSVCRFLWNDELKKQRRQPIVGFEDADMSDHAQLATSIESEARIKLAEKIVTELGDRCQELLVLFYQSALKLKDIATRMGYNSEQTAKNQKYKCLERARNKYKQEQENLKLI